MEKLFEGMVLTPVEYAGWCRQFRVRHKDVWDCRQPAHYGIVERREDGEVIAYMGFDVTRGTWVVFDPDDATDEVEEAFA